MPNYQLRAATQGDFAFLRRLNVATMKDFVARTWGWDDAFQEQWFAEHFDSSQIQIVMMDGVDVGMVVVERGGKEIFLANIEILPEYQGRGLGAAIIGGVIAEADARSLPVTLRVLKVNDAARRLYERLGFIVSGEIETHFLMTHVSDFRPVP